MTANLAAALVAEGHKAGALDCDVYGYSIPRMLGLGGQRPKVTGERKIVPLEAHGIKVMSIGFFIAEDEAVVWRGPMLHKALQQFLEDVAWGELDYLLIDLPPGTGDVSMTLAQLLPQAKFAIVTTPQPAAQTVAKRAADMALKFDLELLGVIEQAPDDPKQAWAVQMDTFLRGLQATVEQARACGRDRLEPGELAGHEAAYELIIALGNKHNPAGTIPTGKRGVIKQTPARNLLVRLDRDREAVLRFAHDFRVPFDNNQAERDIRMIKLQQKISGCWRTITGAEHFLALRAYLSTANKQHQPIANTLTALATHHPWLPATDP